MKNRTRFVTAIFAVLVTIALFLIPLPQRIGLDTRIVTVALIQRPPTTYFDYVTTPLDGRLASVFARGQGGSSTRSGRAGDGGIPRGRQARQRCVDSRCGASGKWTIIRND